MKNFYISIIFCLFSLPVLFGQTLTVSDANINAASTYTFTYVNTIDIGTGTLTPNVFYVNFPATYPGALATVAGSSFMDPYIDFSVDGVPYTCSASFGSVGGNSSSVIQLSVGGATTGLSIPAGSTIEVVVSGLITNPSSAGNYTWSWNTSEGTGAITESYTADVAITVPCTNTSSTDVQTACDTYDWIDGMTYTSSNATATHVIPNAAGCDSIITLDLTINNSTSSTDVQTACDTYDWIDGMTYTSSNNTATHVIPNAAGCDSIITLDLTINNSTSSTDVQTACDTYDWIDGMTYTSSNNTATHVIPNAAGCDSIITLDLTINNSTSSTDVQTACDTYDWIDGMTYTSSNNTATHTLTSAAGCDSIVTLDLTINNSTTGTDVQTACGSFTWIDGMTYTANNNTATFTLQTAAGCDSVVTLDLTIGTATTGTDVLVECDSYTWIDGTTYTADNNTATFTLQTAAGCDSVVTLNLTILNSSSSTEVVGSCDPYVWPVNGMTYSTTGIYVATIPNAAGCDSIITLDFTLNTATSSTETVAVCGDYVWSADGNTYSTAGTYTATIPNAAGCDSNVTLILTIATVSNIGVTLNSVDATLIADLAPSVNVSYNWLDCDNVFSPVIGASAQSYTPSIAGNYAVRITENGCVDTSACFLVDNVGLDFNELASVSIVPNPTTEVVVLTFEGSEAKLTILDLNGKLMTEMTVISGSQVDMSAFENGVYLFIMYTDSFKTVERVVKQ